MSSRTSKRYIFKINWDKFVANDVYKDIGEFKIIVVVKNKGSNNSEYEIQYKNKDRV